MIRTDGGALYTGISTDPQRRFAEHEDDGPRCARALRGKGPLQLVMVNSVGDQSTALRIERRVKRLSKAQKERLISEHHEGRQRQWNELVRDFA